MDIEEVAHSTPEKIITLFVDPCHRPGQAQGEELARAMGMPPNRRRSSSTCARSSTSATWTPTPRWWKSTPESRQQGQHHRPGRQVQLRLQRPVPPPRDRGLRDLDEEDPAKSKPQVRPGLHFSWTATSAAWSTVLVWPWPPWTPSSCSAEPPTSWTWAAVPPPEGDRSLQDHAQEPQGQGHPGQHLRRHHEVRHHRHRRHHRLQGREPERARWWCA